VPIKAFGLIYRFELFSY